MKSSPGFSPRIAFWIRVAATVAGWILLVALFHQLAHAYQAEIVEILNSPLLQLAASSLLLSGLVYFVVLSLPGLPALGPRSMGMVWVWAALLVGGHSLSHMGFHDAQAMLAAVRDEFGTVALMVLALAYAMALAMPFVPGLELGLLIMAVVGPTGALVAYAATIAGLCLAFAVGRILPESVLAQCLSRIGIAMPRAGITSGMQSIIASGGRAGPMPGRLAGALLRHRYLTLGLCLNFPGNAALGGGGGLALLCGMSRRFSWGKFILTVAIATSVVPALVLFGLLNLEPLMQHHGFVHDALAQIARLFTHD